MCCCMGGWGVYFILFYFLRKKSLKSSQLFWSCTLFLATNSSVCFFLSHVNKEFKLRVLISFLLFIRLAAFQGFFNFPFLGVQWAILPPRTNWNLIDYLVIIILLFQKEPTDWPKNASLPQIEACFVFLLMDMRNGISFGNACHDTSSWKSFVSIHSPLVLHSFEYPFVVLEVFGL